MQVYNLIRLEYRTKQGRYKIWWQMFLPMLEVNKQKSLPLPPTAHSDRAKQLLIINTRPHSSCQFVSTSGYASPGNSIPWFVYVGGFLNYNVWKQPIVTSVVTASWPIANQTLPPLTYTMPMTNC